MSVTSYYNKQAFEQLIKANFSFAVSDFGMRFQSVRMSGGSDLRDSALVARYTGPEFRFDVGWSDFQLSLSILINFDKLELPRQEGYAYFEPFVEFLTNGHETAIVPYITENMSIREISAVIDKRRTVFKDGLKPVADRLAQKMKGRFNDLIAASADQIRSYHHWIKSKG